MTTLLECLAGLPVRRPTSTATLVEADVLSALKRLPAESIDRIVTSPPYNIGKRYSHSKDARPPAAYLAWLDAVFLQLSRVLRPDGHFFLNIGFTPTHPWIAQEVAEAARRHFTLQNSIVWVKSISIADDTVGHFKPVNSNRFLNSNWEPIYHFTKSGSVPLDKLAIGVPYKFPVNRKRWASAKSTHCQGNVWFIPYETVNSKAERGAHPAVYPAELPLRCLKLSGTSSCHVVLDPFSGTGSTGVAALVTKAEYLGIDNSPTYHKFAESRLRAANQG